MSVHQRSRLPWLVAILLGLGANQHLCSADVPGSPLFSLTGHTGGIFHVVYSPDGKMLATSSKDSTARLWDAATAKLLFTLTHERIQKDKDVDVFSSAFSPDSKYLATACENHVIKLWDTTTGKEVRQFRGHGNDVYCVCFSPDGTRLASGAHDQTARLWDVKTGALLHTLDGHSGRVLGVAFTPDGSRVVSACGTGQNANDGSGGEVCIWDAQTGHRIFSLPARNTGVISIAFSPDGKRLAGSCLRKTVKVWELATGQECLVLNGHTREVYHVAFSPNGLRLASCSGFWSEDRAGEVKIWDVATGTEVAGFTPHQTPIWSLSFHPDGTRLATCTGRWNGNADAEAKVWDLSRLPSPVVPPPPDARRLDAMWAELGGDDAVRAYSAVRMLSATPKETIPFLTQRVNPPIGNAAYERIPRLIADLDDEDGNVRDKAAAELERLGQVAHAALRKALQHDSAEVRRHARRLLEIKGDAPPLSAEEVQMVRAIEVLQIIGTPDVKPALRKLAAGAAEAPVTREARTALKMLERKMP
jgi:WD40 repeat protein